MGGCWGRREPSSQAGGGHCSCRGPPLGPFSGGPEWHPKTKGLNPQDFKGRGQGEGAQGLKASFLWPSVSPSVRWAWQPLPPRAEAGLSELPYFMDEGTEAQKG